MILDQLIFTKKDVKSNYKEDKVSEKPLRSIAKAFSWRLIGTLDTLLVSYLLTGKIMLAASIASVDFVTKLVLYFFHERVWNTIKWGK
jgi:Predicted membrane protein